MNPLYFVLDRYPQYWKETLAVEMGAIAKPYLGGTIASLQKSCLPEEELSTIEESSSNPPIKDVPSYTKKTFLYIALQVSYIALQKFLGVSVFYVALKKSCLALENRAIYSIFTGFLKREGISLEKFIESLSFPVLGKGSFFFYYLPKSIFWTSLFVLAEFEEKEKIEKAKLILKSSVDKLVYINSTMENFSKQKQILENKIFSLEETIQKEEISLKEKRPIIPDTDFYKTTQLHLIRAFKQQAKEKSLSEEEKKSLLQELLRKTLPPDSSTAPSSEAPSEDFQSTQELLFSETFSDQFFAQLKKDDLYRLQRERLALDLSISKLEQEKKSLFRTFIKETDTKLVKELITTYEQKVLDLQDISSNPESFLDNLSPETGLPGTTLEENQKILLQLQDLLPVLVKKDLEKNTIISSLLFSEGMRFLFFSLFISYYCYGYAFSVALMQTALLQIRSVFINRVCQIFPKLSLGNSLEN